MKSFKRLTFFLIIVVQNCLALDSPIILSSKIFNPINQIFLGSIDGWYFKEGNDTNWSKKDIDITSWQKLKPTELSINMTDKNGRLEGWFRIKIKLIDSLLDLPLYIKSGTWAALDLYLDGNLLHSFGTTGTNLNNYKEFNPYLQNPIPLNLEKGKEYTFSFHIVDYKAIIPLFQLKSQVSGIENIIVISNKKYIVENNFKTSQRNRDVTVYLSVNFLIFLFFFLLSIQNRKEIIFRYCALLLFIYTLISYCSFSLNSNSLSFETYSKFFILKETANWVLSTVGLIIMSLMFADKILKALFVPIIFFICVAITSAVISRDLFSYEFLLKAFVGLTFYSFCIYIIITQRQKLKGAKLIFLAAAILGSSCTVFWYFLPKFELVGDYLFYLSMPIGTMAYVTQTFKENLIFLKNRNKEILNLSREKQQLLSTQNEQLELKVKVRTNELQSSLNNLKSTQTQLIQSEKMASLGELTAGIAHEIQNPLNFVNNFSELSNELIDEMKDELQKGNQEDAFLIADDIKQNLEKINHHGKRADAIVKGMLQHSRSSSGVKEPTDINALCDEYLRLCYHGLRAKDKSFNATMKTDFDQSIGKINIKPQDMGRVVLNLLTNAFYAVDEKKKSGLENYEPTVSISTKKVDGKVEIKVKDNGNGIPQNIVDKIFQPFFTTKPTGQGTGLGLSLSYDIVTKGHGGELKVETKEGKGSVFILNLPTS